uniref:Uncharacterized protein n=1 Tax=Panagrolaimus sp. ES5 TaxID=591445 RepID=A0AC34GVA7_9BILA
MATLIVKTILTSTLPTNITTTEASIFGEIFGENGLTVLIIASILVLIGLMILCCCCASHSSGGNSSRRYQSVLPVRAPTQSTTVTRTHSTIYANQKGQPILKTYKVSTHSSASGESINAQQSQDNLLPVVPAPSTVAYNKNSHHQHQPQQQQQHRNPFYEQHQHQNNTNTNNPFYDVPLDTVSAPRKLTHDYYARRGLQQYSSDI